MGELVCVVHRRISLTVEEAAELSPEFLSSPGNIMEITQAPANRTPPAENSDTRKELGDFLTVVATLMQVFNFFVCFWHTSF